MHRKACPEAPLQTNQRNIPRQLPKLPHEPSSTSSSSSTCSGTNGVSRNSFSDTPPSRSHPRLQGPRSLPSLTRIGNTSFGNPPEEEAMLSSSQHRHVPVEARKTLRFIDTRNNRQFTGPPSAWRGSGKPSNPPPKSAEARAMSQSYQQFINLKILLSESRRYAWDNIVLRHPEASTDEVLVYQFNSTWAQLMDDVTTAIVERQVANVAAAGAVVNMMELFQRHSPAVDLLPDTSPPIGPRHLPIDWFEAQRQEVRVAVVEERQARKGRAVMRASRSQQGTH